MKRLIALACFAALSYGVAWGVAQDTSVVDSGKSSQVTSFTNMDWTAIKKIYLSWQTGASQTTITTSCNVGFSGELLGWYSTQNTAGTAAAEFFTDRFMFTVTDSDGFDIMRGYTASETTAIPSSGSTVSCQLGYVLPPSLTFNIINMATGSTGTVVLYIR